MCMIQFVYHTKREFISVVWHVTVKNKGIMVTV